MELVPQPPPRERDRPYIKKPDKRGLLGEAIDKEAVYEFFMLSPEERERQRFLTKRYYLDQTLGGRFHPDSANETARRLGSWEESAVAKAAGMSKWEMRKVKSRQALEAANMLDDDTRQRKVSEGSAAAAGDNGVRAATPLTARSSNAGSATPRPPSRGSPVRSARGAADAEPREPLQMLARAAEFGYDGHPYIQLEGRLQDVLKSRAVQGTQPARIDVLTPPTPPPAPANSPVAKRDAADPQPASLPPVNAAPQAQTAAPAARPAQQAGNNAIVDFSLAGLSYTELNKVMEAVDILSSHFPDSRYLGPLQAQVLNAAASK